MQEKNEQSVAIEMLEPPLNYLKYMRMQRGATIFQRMQYACLIMLGVIALSIVVLPLLQISLMIFTFMAIPILIVFSLGYVFVLDPNPIVIMWKFLGKLTNMEFMDKTLNLCVDAIPYLCIIGMVLTVGTTLLTVFNKSAKKTKLIVPCILFVLFMIMLVLYFLLGGDL